MRNCQRCGGEVSWTKDTTELLGGVSAHLCNACRTEWHRACKASPLWDQLEQLDARSLHLTALALAERPADEAVFLEYVRAKNALEDRFGEMAAEFVRPLAVPAAAGG